MPLSDIVGHGQVLDLLRRAVGRDVMPQSLLLAGPDGVGKRAVAIAIAQAVNCPVRAEASAADACGTCPTCERIAAGRHSDVVLLGRDGEPSIKIKPLRERVLDAIGYRPFEARRRVFVIDPAEAMTGEAQDALLKTLEEPPSASMLILVSAMPDTLRATIRSRCRRLRFGPLSDADLARVLVERLGHDAGQAHALASVAAGSVSRALSEDAGDLDADRDAALALLTAAGGRALPARLKAAAALVQHGTKRRDREALSVRLAVATSLVRDLTALAAGHNDRLANADLADTLGRLGGAFDAARADAAFAALSRARQALDRNASPKIVADWLAVTL